MRQIEMFTGDYNPRLDMLGWTGLYTSKGSLKGAPGTSLSLQAYLTELGTEGKKRKGKGGNWEDEESKNPL